MLIGLDFDNTIAGYDRVFPEAAAALGLLPSGAGGSKAAVRAMLRDRPGGEAEWQRLQGQVYGRFMPGAELLPGVADFLRAAAAQGCRVVVVSHKTRFGHADEARIDLRQAALAWMEAQDFFAPTGFGLHRDAVWFEPTRADKVARIAQLAPALFIDDLPEVFAEPHFPAATRRILFTGGEVAASGPYQAFASWDSIRRAVFDA